MSSSSRRRDPGQKQTRAVDPPEESGGDEPLQSQPRAPHHAKKSQKQPTSIIKGDVHIKSVKGNVYLVQGSRDEERPQRSSTPSRNPPHHQQAARTTKRSTTQRDLSSTPEEDATSVSDETEPEEVAHRQSKIPMPPPVRPRKHPEKKKRDQADEGYHTSGTVSYTAQVSGKVKGKGKGEERSVSPVASSSRRPRRDSKMSKETGGETDASSSHSGADDGAEGSAEGDDETEQIGPQVEDEASDDDFLKLPIHIGNPDNQDASPVLEKAILDTGTKVDWISQNFYNDLRNLGVRTSKLSDEELEVPYRDFNGKKFHPTGKVDLMIQTEEFKGDMKFRKMRFLVANKATFAILLGRDTIRKHGFYTRGNCDTAGEGVHIGVLEKLSEAKKAEQKKNTEKQKKLKAEKKAGRDTKNEKTARQKENASLPSSSEVSAHLATTVPRSSKSRSPPEELARRSTSSLEGTW